MTFLFLNGCQLLSIVVLARMYRREQQAAARRANALLGPVLGEDTRDVLTRPVKEPASVREEDWRRPARSSSVGRRTSIRAHSSLSSPHITEETIRLPRTPSGSSSRTQSQYLISHRNSVIESDSDDTRPSPRVLGLKRTRRRGEIWAMVYGSLIVFAWVLFMVTAWLRLRSRDERGGGASSHSGDIHI